VDSQCGKKTGDRHRSQFITLTVNICVERGGREALRRAGLLAVAETCLTRYCTKPDPQYIKIE